MRVSKRLARPKLLFSVIYPVPASSVFRFQKINWALTLEQRLAVPPREAPKFSRLHTGHWVILGPVNARCGVPGDCRQRYKLLVEISHYL